MQRLIFISFVCHVLALIVIGGLSMIQPRLKLNQPKRIAVAFATPVPEVSEPIQTPPKETPKTVVTQTPPPPKTPEKPKAVKTKPPTPKKTATPKKQTPKPTKTPTPKKTTTPKPTVKRTPTLTPRTVLTPYIPKATTPRATTPKRPVLTPNTNPTPTRQPLKPDEPVGVSDESEASRLLPDFYLTAASRVLQQNFTLPEGLYTANVTCTVAFRVQKDGTLTNIQILKSTQDPTRDQYAIQAVQNSKFVDLPVNITKDYVTFEVTFNFARP